MLAHHRGYRIAGCRSTTGRASTAAPDYLERYLRRFFDLLTVSFIGGTASGRCTCSAWGCSQASRSSAT